MLFILNNQQFSNSYFFCKESIIMSANFQSKFA